jgi:hypothetical protein
MAWPLIVGAGMMVGGTALNMYGTSQRDKAAKRAMKDYQNAVNAKTNQDRAALLEEQGLLNGLAQERQGTIKGYLNNIGSAQYGGADPAYQARQTGALTGIREMTQGNDGAFAYRGTPRTQAENMQGDITKRDNASLAEAMLADYTERQIGEREKSASNSMAMADLFRGVKGKSMADRFSLAKALRDLDWQRKSAAMQGQLDDAQRVGQWSNALGGLATQAGGMMAMYGMSQAMAPTGGVIGAGAPAAPGTYFGGANGGVSGMTTMGPYDYVGQPPALNGV